MDECDENFLAEIGDTENINHKDCEFKFDLLTVFRYRSPRTKIKLWQSFQHNYTGFGCAMVQIQNPVNQYIPPINL